MGTTEEMAHSAGIVAVPIPGAGGDRGAARRAGEETPGQGGRAARGAGPGTLCRPVGLGAGSGVPHLQRGGMPRRPASSGCVRSCAATPCGSAGSWPACCPAASLRCTRSWLSRRSRPRAAPPGWAGGEAVLLLDPDRTAEETSWARIAELYAELAALLPSAVVELNRVVAVSMSSVPEAGLALLDALAGEPALAGYHRLPQRARRPPRAAGTAGRGAGAAPRGRGPDAQRAGGGGAAAPSGGASASGRGRPVGRPQGRSPVYHRPQCPVS